MADEEEKIDVSRNIETSKLGKEWTLVEIKRLLRALPPLIRDARQTAIKAEFELEKAKLETKKQFAIAGMKASTNKASLGLTSAEDRKAWVISQPDVEKAEVAEIFAKSNVLIAQSDQTYMENVFAAVRKVANLMEDEYQDQKRVERTYGDGQQG